MSLPVKIYSSEVDLIVEDSAMRKYKIHGKIEGTIDSETHEIKGHLKNGEIVNIDFTYINKVKKVIKILEELL